VIRDEGQREEEVAQPVRPGQKLVPLGLRTMEGPELPLGPPRDRPGDVQERGRARPARENEGVDRRVTLVEMVDVGLQSPNMAVFHSVGRRPTPGGRGELRLHDVELVLQPSDELANVAQRVGELRNDEPEVGPELVVGTVGPDPEGVLLYARTTDETGRASIARPGIETRDTLASGRHGSWSRGELSPWTGQYEM
jgi:hypothetical protein